MLALKLISKRICIGLLEKFLFRLRYLLGFVVFALILWFLKVAVFQHIDTKFLDSIKSDQFIWLEERGRAK